MNPYATISPENVSGSAMKKTSAVRARLAKPRQMQRDHESHDQ